MTEWTFAFLAGTCTGIISGFGIGGGTLLLLYMTAGLGMEQHLAQGINLLYFLPTAAGALPGHLKNGYIDKASLLPAICAGVFCTALSSWLSTGLDLFLLRKCFGIFLIAVGISQLRIRKQ